MWIARVCPFAVMMWVTVCVYVSLYLTRIGLTTARTVCTATCHLLHGFENFHLYGPNSMGVQRDVTQWVHGRSKLFRRALNASIWCNAISKRIVGLYGLVRYCYLLCIVLMALVDRRTQQGRIAITVKLRKIMRMLNFSNKLTNPAALTSRLTRSE